MVNNIIENLKNKVLERKKITYQEALQLVDCDDKNELYAAADAIRQVFIGRNIDLCSIANAKSGKCEEDCKWCSQSRHFQTTVEEYDIINKELAVDMAKLNRSKGVNRYSLVTSGRTVTDSELDSLVVIYKSIKKESDIHLCASMGLLNKEQLQKLKDTGIGHYHCNLETAPSYFSEVCSTHSIEEKMQTIAWAKEVGLDICSGGIIGMGETMAQRIELACALSDLEVNSIPINVLNPIAGTPMAGAGKLTEEEILTTIAIFRFVNPRAHIRFAGGRNLLSIETQKKALHAGISAALVGDYLTTIGTKVNEDKQLFEQEGFSFNS
ncbi:MAG: biotin synthase BioB [Bacteroidales bacterium]|nr:biotin synthase BioB [Bacteroidales bacterium]